MQIHANFFWFKSNFSLQISRFILMSLKGNTVLPASLSVFQRWAATVHLDRTEVETSVPTATSTMSKTRWSRRRRRQQCGGGGGGGGGGDGGGVLRSSRPSRFLAPASSASSPISHSPSHFASPPPPSHPPPIKKKLFDSPRGGLKNNTQLG